MEAGDRFASELRVIQLQLASLAEGDDSSDVQASVRRDLERIRADLRRLANRHAAMRVRLEETIERASERTDETSG
ncbi:MAG TPA: hypothetical protein VGF23_17980 [Gaiellaceae bacterium]